MLVWLWRGCGSCWRRLRGGFVLIVMGRGRWSAGCGCWRSGSLGMGAALRRALGVLEGVVDPVGGGSPVGGVLGAVRAELEEGARLRVPLEVSLCAPGAEGVDGPVVRLFRAARADCEGFWEGAGAQGLGGAASNSTENVS